MIPSTVGKLGTACGLTLLLLGCITPDTSQTATLQSVTRNASQFGADAKRYGDQAAIVTYMGTPRDFIKCSKGRLNVTNVMELDSRTRIVPLGQGLLAETVYVVTTTGTLRSGKTIPVSVSFDRNEVGRFGDGVTCRATGMLERTLLGSG